MPPPLPSQPILILGAGISGLTLAQGLLKAKVPFRLFERDPGLNLRAQGYRFRVQGPGVTALRAVLPPQLFAELEQTCALLAPGAIIHLDALSAAVSDGPKGAPVGDGLQPLNVDRTVMRSVLFQGLGAHVEFGREFVGYEITEGGVEVSFGDGTTVQGCLLVGSDGARSRVKRQLVPDDILLDTQGRFLFGKTPLTAEVSEKFNQDALKGMAMVRDQSQSNPLTLLLEPMRFTESASEVALPEDYIYWVLIAHIDRFGMDDTKLLKLSSEEASTLAEKLVSNWDSSFQSLFTHQSRDQTAMLRIASSTPTLPKWDGMGRVTLIGDAAHAMSPTAGAGATTAVRDAATLAQILVTEGVSVRGLQTYETAMRAYAEDPIRKSMFGGKLMFGMLPFEHLKPVLFRRA